MSSKRTYRVVGMIFLVAALVVLPGSAQALMSVGAQGGINFLANSDIDFIAAGTKIGTLQNVKFDNPSPLGGVNIAYYFLNAGFLKYDWPAWMGYFAVMVDFTYNTFEIRSQNVTVSPGGGKAPIPTMNGTVPCLAFLLMAHYGFLPDSEVPIGRLHPYLAVGPAVVFTSLNAGSLGLGSTSSTDIALATEAGLRWIALPNVHLDVGFRYRFFEPKFSYNVGGTSVDLKPDAIHSFTAIFRVNYVF